jgi:multiple sugar transport system ATP-binding protein
MAQVLLRGVSVPGSTIEGVDLDVEAGERVVVADTSSEAPSLLVRALAGLGAVDGEFRIGERAMPDVAPPARPIGFVPRGGGLVDGWTVRRNLEVPLRRQGASASEAESRLVEAAHLAELGEVLELAADELPPALRQRVALARALARRPALLLCDDAAGDLDPDEREAFGATLAAAVRRTGAAAILATTDPVEALWLGERLVVWTDGRRRQEGAPADVWDSPADRAIAGWLGRPVMNLLELPVADGRVALAELAFAAPVAAEGRVVLGIRPEHVHLLGAEAEGPSLRARVERVVRTGAAAHLELSVAGGTLRAWCAAARAPRERMDVAVRVEPGDVRLFSAADGRALGTR